MASLEVHQINVGQGDAILVVNRDLVGLRKRIGDLAPKQKPPLTVPTTFPDIDLMPWAARKLPEALQGTATRALLVDGGDDAYGDDVVGYLVQHGVLPETKDGDAPKAVPGLTVVISHFHDDHMAGLRHLFNRRVETTVVRTSRTGSAKGTTVKVDYEQRYRPGTIYMTAANKKADPKTVRFSSINADIARAKLTLKKGAAPTKVEHLDRGGQRTTIKGFSGTTISLGTVGAIPIDVHVLAAAQSVLGADALPEDVKGTSKAVDQNDRSVVLLLEHGSFRYFLGGDIAGTGLAAQGNLGDNEMTSTGKKWFSSSHGNVEEPLGKAMKARYPAVTAAADKAKFTRAGYCTVAKASHHGSASSDDVHFLATITPMLAIISSGLKARFHRHPTQQVIDRMSVAVTPDWGQPGTTATIPNTIEQIYATEVAATAAGKPFGVKLRSTRILGDIVVRPTDASVLAVQKAAKAGQRLEVQVYGSGIRTELTAPRYVARPCTAGTDTTGVYPVGPWLHSDVH